MANHYHLDVLRQGTEVWNELQRTHPNLSGDFSAADLHGMNLEGANFHGANFHGANLSAARLLRTNLQEANLTNANLKGAFLQGCNMKKAILSWGVFEEAICLDLDLTTIILASQEEAVLQYCIF